MPPASKSSRVDTRGAAVGRSVDVPRRRIPDTPALDGLRAIAVVAVVVYHQEPGLVPGGWLGVSMFFTLSGFLIGDLLLAEHASTGRVDLRAFWARRIRRLVPASVLALALATGALLFIGGDRGAAVADIRAAALQVANWRFIAADAPYAGVEGTASPVQHYWSLAIEEQFYLVLPLVAALTLRRRIFGWVVAAVLAASLAAQLSIDDLDRAYFGTDTRAAELAAGVGLAVALPWLRTALAGRRTIADAWGFAALAGTGVAFLVAERTSALVGAGGLTAVTVLWVGLIAGAAEGRHFARLLRRWPLVPIGRLSYGIYLYHWPVFLVITSTRTGYTGATLLAVRAGLTLALAWLSAQLVELPIRRGALATPRLVTAGGAALASVVLASLLVVPGSAPQQLAAELLPPPVAAGAAPAPVDDVPVGDAQVDDVAGRPAPGPTPVEADLGGEPAVGPAPPGPEAEPAVPQVRPTRLLVVGDSTATITGDGLRTAAADRGDAEVYVLSQPGCTVLPQDVARIRDGFEYRSPCQDIIGQAVAAASDVRPDAIVVFLGSAQLPDARYGGGAEWQSILDPAVAGAYTRSLTDALGRLGALGVPVLWADVPTPDWDLDAFGEVLGAPVSGTGESSANDPARSERLNALDHQVLTQHPFARHWGFADALAGPDGHIDPGLRSDGLHLVPSIAADLARSTLLDRLRAEYGAALDATGTRDRVAAEAPTPAWSTG